MNVGVRTLDVNENDYFSSNQEQVQSSQFGGAATARAGARPKRIFDRLYQASGSHTRGEGTYQSILKESFKANVFHDSSLFTASLRKERMQAKIQRLKAREQRVIQERKDRIQKQDILAEI